MTKGLVFFVLCIAGSCAGQISGERADSAKPNPAEQALALNNVREYARLYSASLPDYTCIQTTHRTIEDLLGGPARVDTIGEQISFVNGREIRASIKINGRRPSTADPAQNGAVSRGEFGNLLETIFDPRSGSDIRWKRAATLNSQPVYVFAYRVPQSSGYILAGLKERVQVPFQGLVYADRQTGAVLRIDMECTAIPASSGYKDMNLTLSYKTTKINGKGYLLPARFSMHYDRARNAGIIGAEYKSCRKFSTDSTLSFDVDAGVAGVTSAETQPPLTQAREPADTIAEPAGQLPMQRPAVELAAVAAPPKETVQTAPPEDRLAAVVPLDKEIASAPIPVDRPIVVEQPIIADQPVIKVNVRQVIVPVVVTDRDGRHIPGLSRDDFTIFEDGVEQKIIAFSAENETPSRNVENAPQTPAAAGGEPARAPVRRTYVICVDTMHTSPQGLASARKALTKLLLTERSTDAQYALISLGATMQVLQNPTRDPDAVIRALGDDSFRKALMGSSTSTQFELASFEERLNGISSICGDIDPSVRLRDPERQACQMDKLSVPRQAESLANQERAIAKGFLAELRSVVDQLARANDRRTLILISDGFGMSPGKAIYELAYSYFPTFHELALRSAAQDNTDLLAIQQVAQRNNIPIYTIDARGLYTSKTLDASRSGISQTAAPRVEQAWQSIQAEDGETLSEIASATGGISFQNNNDLYPALDRAFADGRDYYTLAYVPTNDALDGKFRKIVVRLRDDRLQAIFKRGYWGDKP